MENKIFLQEFKRKGSVSNDSGLNVGLQGKQRLLGKNDASYAVSEYEQYLSERSSSTKVRLSFQVNTICSNVLFNKISEVVKDEGSNHVTVLNYGLKGYENEDENKKVFEGVVNKPGENINKTDDIDSAYNFWSGNLMGYISFDQNILNMSYSQSLSNISKRQIPNVFELTTGESLHPTNAIRDMQLSNIGFTYHCGLDVFNNHLVRSRTFKTICLMNEDDKDKVTEGIGINENTGEPEYLGGYGAFNTIADYMRDIHGNRVVEKVYFPINAGVDGNTKIVSMHLYEYDDVYTFEDCWANRLISKYNGWVGFNNTAKLKSYGDFVENKSLNIDRPLMNMNGGDFVDMYPSRDLYSFIPKWNKHQKRIEKNWNYCITYPSSSTTEGFDDIFETLDGINALKAVYYDESTNGFNGASQTVIYSVAKHGLSSGDYINIYVNRTEEDEEGNETTYADLVASDAMVTYVVDDFTFTVFTGGKKISNMWYELTEDDLANNKFALTDTNNEITMTYTIDPNTKAMCSDENGNIYPIVNGLYVNLDDNAQKLSYKKVVSGVECDYYVRIFSRLPNFRFASGTTSAYDIYEKNDGEMLKEYQKPEYEFSNQLSRLAFAKNIYTDDIAQVVFTDDIDIANIKDNRGRPITSLYFSVFKNNRGYKHWYGFKEFWKKEEINENYEDIEFSHCFGKLTCGIEMSKEAYLSGIPNGIKSINNGGIDGGFDCAEINGRDPVNDITLTDVDDNEVWYWKDRNFYGDIAYYDPYNAVERVLQPFLHRFNTAQRESKRSLSEKYYSTFLYDEIFNDDYDKNDKYVIKSHTVSGCNNLNEGYYYAPHYEVRVNTFSKLNDATPMFLTIRSLVNLPEGTRVTTRQSHYLSAGDKAMIYDTINDKYYVLVTKSFSGSKTFVCDIFDEEGNRTSDVPDIFSTSDYHPYYKLFKIDNMKIPEYAHLLRDGTCRFVWRDVVRNGVDMDDKTLEVYPFTNGALYVNTGIDIFVKRQDPFKDFGLYDETLDMLGIELESTDEDSFVEEEDVEC